MKYCWILFFIFFRSSSSSFVEFSAWPPDGGCTEELDISKCLISIYCSNSVSWNPYLYSFDYLDNFSNGYEFTLNCNNGKDTGYESLAVPNIDCNHYYQEDCGKIEKIKLFDVSNQNCFYTPNLAKMSQLTYLNLSHNVITVAKLYNKVYLNSLTNIDYSYNKISRIDISGEHKFINITWLNLSHNEIEYLPDAIFSVYSKLNNLDLSFNRLKKIELMFFEGIKNLLYLNLSHNNITNINSSFIHLGKLQVLNLSFNNIKIINSHDFQHLTNLKVLDMSFNCIVTIEKTLFNGMPLLNNINLRHNLVESIDKDLFINNKVLKVVDISNNNLDFLPKYLFQNNSISLFSIDGNKLKGSLVKGTFAGLTLVSDLNLGHQSLTALDDYAFYGTELLKELILNNNYIHSISKTSFRNLFHLNYLDLSNNNLTNISFEKDDLISLTYLSLENNFLKQLGQNEFSTLKFLNFLSLACNNISKLRPKTFESLQNLEYFYIYKNPLSGRIQEAVFEGLNSLPKLDLSSTNLTEISNNSFNGMHQMKVFNVSHSFICKLQYNTFSNTSQIEIMDLSYNKLKTFLLNPIHLPKITELLLNNNLLNVISENSFKGLYSLETLDLSNNDIQIISYDAFIDQISLKDLHLSHNNLIQFIDSISKYTPMLNVSILKRINHLYVKSFPQTENIDLKYNNISTLSIGEFSSATILKALDVSHNKIKYIQPAVFEYNTHLLYLNISHNELMELNYGVFEGLVKLTTLDLSFNALHDLRNERFYELENLEQLIVDHNNIDSFNPEDFFSTRLQVLSIGENPLPCEILINLNKANNVPFKVTAINIMKHEENVKGITCNKNKIPASNFNYTQLPESNKVLFEIRDELVRIANDNSLQRNSAPTNDVESKFNNLLLLEKILKLNNEHEMQLTNYSDIMSKQVNDTNILLRTIIDILINYRKTTTSIPFTKYNTTLDKKMPYKIKKELGEHNISEIDTINIKTHKENSKLSQNSSTYLPPSQESLKDVNSNVQPKSVFTDVCVGLILIILVGYMLYKIYKYKFYIRPRRSPSTRELEIQNL